MTPPASPPTAQAGRRVAWIDYARGLAITLVVYGHCYRGIASAGIVPPGGALGAVDGLIYGFHMPLFFFLSGLFGVRAAARPAGVFWRARLRTIVWPYMLWMSLELLLLWLFAGATNMGAIAIGPSIYAYNPISPFWFLYALLFCAVFVHLAHPLGRWTMMALAALLFVAGQAVPVEIVALTSWGILYYSAGATLAGLVQDPRFERRVARPAVVATACAATLGLGLLLPALGVPYRWEIPVAIAGSLALFGLAVRLQEAEPRLPALAWIAYLGRISLTVLVVHVLATASTRILIAKVLGAQPGWLHLVLGTAAGLVAPCVVQDVCTRLRIAAALGLPAGTAPRRRLA